MDSETIVGILGDYRITRTEDGLRIEALDYHTDPLVLTREQLGELGFVPAERKDGGRKESRPHRFKGATLQ